MGPVYIAMTLLPSTAGPTGRLPFPCSGFVRIGCDYVMCDVNNFYVCQCASQSLTSCTCTVASDITINFKMEELKLLDAMMHILINIVNNLFFRLRASTTNDIPQF